MNNPPNVCSKGVKRSVMNGATIVLKNMFKIVVLYGTLRSVPLQCSLIGLNLEKLRSVSLFQSCCFFQFQFFVATLANWISLRFWHRFNWRRGQQQNRHSGVMCLKTRTNEFGSMTARKDDTSPIKAITDHQKAI